MSSNTIERVPTLDHAIIPGRADIIMLTSTRPILAEPKLPGYGQRHTA